MESCSLQSSLIPEKGKSRDCSVTAQCAKGRARGHVPITCHTVPQWDWTNKSHWLFPISILKCCWMVLQGYKGAHCCQSSHKEYNFIWKTLFSFRTYTDLDYSPPSSSLPYRSSFIAEQGKCKVGSIQN